MGLDCIQSGRDQSDGLPDFNRINYQYLRHTIEALETAAMMPARFLYMSSLSALGPCDEKNYEPYRAGMIPCPDTRYGTSKIKAETVLETTPGLDWIIFRPTGVYGPHEQDYLMMVKCIDRHWDFGIGFRKQLLTFIYVEDLATAIFDALERGKTGKKYIISEPRAYTQKEFRRIVSDALGGKWVIPVRLPSDGQGGIGSGREIRRIQDAAIDPQHRQV